MASYATFTVHSREASRKLSGYLAENGFEEAKGWAWTASDPTYHLDLAVLSGGAKSDFSWTTQQFLRVSGQYERLIELFITIMLTT
jgi:hypothetical protein